MANHARRRVHPAAAAVSALALAACGTTDDVATSAPDETATSTETTETAETTETSETTSEEPTASEEPTTESAESTTGEASPSGGTDETAYPADSIGYARAFVDAWAAEDDATVADLAVDVVTLGAESWGTSADQGEAYSCSIDGMGEEWEGLDLVTLQHPDVAGTDLLIRRSALGGPDAVVAVDHGIPAEVADTYMRPATTVDEYSYSFVEAWVEQDRERMTHLANEEVTTMTLESRVPVDGAEPRWMGFMAEEGSPLIYVVDVPIQDSGTDFFDTVEVDVDLALADEPHAVVGTNVTVDPRYSGMCGDDITTEPAP